MIDNSAQSYEYFRLANGMRLIHRRTSQPVAHLALMIDTGTRDELPHENGMAHLIEHMMFKGTVKRKAYHVLSRLEHIGGDLNAFTTKEETCIHASFTAENYARVADLFADIFFHSVYPQKELEKEKDVILDEIKSYKDNPGEEIFDEFENLIFKGHPIGQNILGTEENLLRFGREDIFQFIRENYDTRKMVIASVGNISFAKLTSLIINYFEAEIFPEVSFRRDPFISYQVSHHSENRSNYLSHCMIGNVACSRRDPKKPALILLNNLLGGQGMNSRLNLNIREKYGFTYTIESNFTSYSDTGIFSVYFGTDPRSVERTMELVFKELEKLRNNRLGDLQLHRAKTQILGQLAISLESGMNEALSMARGHLLRERVDTAEQSARKINALTADQLLEVAQQTFDRDRLSVLLYVGGENE